MTMIIGLGHYSRVGKDTLANFLMECIGEYAPHLKTLKRSLAWKLKEITHELYGWAGLREPAYYEENGEARKIKLPVLNMTPVEIWVAFGTKAVRDNVYARSWLDYLLKTDFGCDVLIIPDIRFPNEADAVKAAGGKLIKVVRPGYGPLDTVADKALIGYAGWDYIVGAEGTMQSLKHWASVLAQAVITHEWIEQNDKEQALEVEKLCALA
jgi:hypothetical protein